MTPPVRLARYWNRTLINTQIAVDIMESTRESLADRLAFHHC